MYKNTKAGMVDLPNYYNPLGPIYQAKKILMNNHSVTDQNIDQRFEIYLKSLKTIDDLAKDDFRAFFWSVKENQRNLLMRWFFRNTPELKEIIDKNYFIKNQGVATALFYLYEIKGLVFSMDLSEKGLDVMVLNLNNTAHKNLFDDLVRIFSFIRNPVTKKGYLDTKFPILSDLRRAIYDWQEDQGKNVMNKIDNRIKITEDGLIYEADKIAIYHNMLVWLPLYLDAMALEAVNSLN